MKKIVGVIFLCLIIGVLSYFGTLYLDKLKQGGEVKVTVTFDDTNTYIIPSIKKMDKEEALDEWPYIMEVENDGSGKALYQIIITQQIMSLKSLNILIIMIIVLIAMTIRPFYHLLLRNQLLRNQMDISRLLKISITSLLDSLQIPHIPNTKSN